MRTKRKESAYWRTKNLAVFSIGQTVDSYTHLEVRMVLHPKSLAQRGLVSAAYESTPAKRLQEDGERMSILQGEKSKFIVLCGEVGVQRGTEHTSDRFS